MDQTKTISEEIREAMIATGLNDLEISRHVDVSQPQLWKFRHGKTDPRASTIDALATWLGYRLVRDKSKAPKVTPKKRGPQKHSQAKEPKNASD